MATHDENATPNTRKRKLEATRITRSKVGQPATLKTPTKAASKIRAQSKISGSTSKLTKKLVKPQFKTEEEQQKFIKNVFSTNYQPDKLIGREKQQKVIEDFLTVNLKAEICRSIYISGAAGIGKTATIDQCLSKLNKKVTVIKVNCMAGNVWQSILGQVEEDELDGNTAVDKVEHLFQEKDQFFILMLDEVDHITQQEVLYRIFEWPSKKKFRVLIIGIANTIDLTQRLLPRLQARDCQPEHVVYGAYTTEEVSAILKYRIKHIQEQLDTDEQIIHPAAIELAARKVAAFGDFRKALDLCRYALDLKTGPFVSVLDMVKAIDRSFGVVNSTSGKLQKFTIHQKSILVTILLMSRYDKAMEDALVNVEPTMLRIFEVYVQLCRNGNFGSQLSRSEFVDILTSIETSGIIEAIKKGVQQTPNKPKMQAQGYFTPGNRKKAKVVVKTPQSAKSQSDKFTLLNPQCKVRMCVSEDEIAKAVETIPNLKALLQEPSGLPDAVVSKLNTKVM